MPPSGTATSCAEKTTGTVGLTRYAVTLCVLTGTALVALTMPTLTVSWAAARSVKEVDVVPVNIREPLSEPAGIRICRDCRVGVVGDGVIVVGDRRPGKRQVDINILAERSAAGSP